MGLLYVPSFSKENEAFISRERLRMLPLKCELGVSIGGTRKGKGQL